MSVDGMHGAVDKKNASLFMRLLWGALLFVVVLVLHGAVPGLLMPTNGQAAWILGFAESFRQTGLFSIYAPHIGAPEPAAIAFGLPGAILASIFLRLGIAPDIAYTLGMACWLFLAYWCGFRLALRFGCKPLVSLFLAFLWLITPVIIYHHGYSMLAVGIALLSAYFYAAFCLVEASLSQTPLWKFYLTFIAYVFAAVLAVFMDGYSFMMFAVGASGWLGWLYISQPTARRKLLRCALPVHGIAMALAFFLYTSYVGTTDFGRSSLGAFRGWGVDVAFWVWPGHGQHWLPDLLGLSEVRRAGPHQGWWFGDDSVWWTTFALPLFLAALIAYLVYRPKHSLLGGFLLVALFAAYMALGPSLKVHSERTETGGGSWMPAEEAVAPTGNALLSIYLPGFKSMRAAYRWSALLFFMLWLVLVVSLAKSKRQWVVLSGLLVVGVFYLPHPDKLIEKKRKNVDIFASMEREFVDPLMADTTKGEKAVFLPWGNDFLISYVAPATGLVAFNIGGDKNVAMAKKHWPELLKPITRFRTLDSFDTEIVGILSNGIADVVVLPKVNMLWAPYNWPSPWQSDSVDATVKALSSNDQVVLLERQWYSIVRLNEETSVEALPSGALGSMVLPVETGENALNTSAVGEL